MGYIFRDMGYFSKQLKGHWILGPGLPLCIETKIDSVIQDKGKKTFKISFNSLMERSGSVVECLTRDQGAAGSSITGITALCS